jgi:hypothetical protein
MSERERHPRAFPDLAPPAGGLAKLRARLDVADRRRARLLTLAFVPSLAAAAAVIAFVVARPGANHVDELDLDAQPALATTHGDGAHVEGAVPVPLSNGATLYWVR